MNGFLNYFQEDTHKDWVSCVRFSPNAQNPIIVSCGWDRVVKVMSFINLLRIIQFVPNDYELNIIFLMNSCSAIMKVQICIHYFIQASLIKC